MHLTKTAGWSWSTDVANEKDVGPDRLRGVCLIKRVEDPAVLSQHRVIGQGDATRMSPSSPSVAVRRASREDDA